MNTKTTSDNVLFRWTKPKNLSASGIQLLKELSRETRWAEAVVCGPDSRLKPGDQMLLSARPTCYTFEIDGEILMNSSDAATLCYKNHGFLHATKGTVIYEWIELPEEVTESGIVLVKAENNRIQEVRWAKVHAAGPDSGVQRNDEVLIAYDRDAYQLKNIIEGKTLHNCGKEHIIAFRHVNSSK
jgi:co-chaperonin GroES (HSP10)